jgi:signal transduction histidine kinase
VESISFYKEGYSRDKFTAVFNRLRETGQSFDEEFQLVTKQGKEVWVKSIGKPQYDPQGNVSGAFGVFQDITEQKEKELALISSNQKLQVLTEELSLRNKKLRDFAHIASHNLRAPVANLMQLRELYANEKDPEELKSLL